jgi:hypothetical protein
MCKELAKELRSQLKELGYNRTMVSVTSDYNSINVAVKSIDVDFKKVAELANSYEKLDRDEMTGEILQGGNTYVYIDYSETLMEILKNKYMDKAKEIFEAIQKSNDLENIFIKDGVHAFLGDFQMIWFRVPQTDGTTKRYKCYNCESGIAEVFAKLFLNEKIDILETSETFQEVSIVEELKKESEIIINSINTESLETQKESFELINTQLDKIYKTIQENLNNEDIRQQLRDIENDLKWQYSSLDEMIEEQTMPDANDFNNIETLKTIYLTNWNELPEEIQNYILSCDKYWIDLQSINLYKDNRIVASMRISGHHKHDIEVNSIGAGELFQWSNKDGYTLNNLEVSVDNELTKQPEIIINEDLAKRAKENMSFDDYKEGSATEEYNSVVENMTVKINEAKEEVKDDNEKINQLDYLLTKFKKDYANWINKKNANGANHVSVMISGASNYNMNKHNKYVSREDKLWQEYNDIMTIEDKIDKIINSKKIIKSTDSDAIEKLKEKLEQEQKSHDEMINYNKQARKEKKEVYPSYMITNSNQRIKNIKDRILQLEKLEELKETQGNTEIKINGIKIIDNLEANRVQMIFPDKPKENIRKILKSNGFIYSYKNNAWQRNRSRLSADKAKSIAESLKDDNEKNIAM